MGEDGDGDNYLRVLDRDGAVVDFARNALSDSELCGACFSPDGSALFVNLQENGLTLVVTGPFPSAVVPPGPDAGVPDAGAPDAGTPDAAPPAPELPDAAPIDAAPPTVPDDDPPGGGGGGCAVSTSTRPSSLLGGLIVGGLAAAALKVSSPET
jgi:hypothetical protein